MITQLNIVMQFMTRTLVALALSLLLSSYRWWAPVVSFPLVMVIGFYIRRPRWRVQARYLAETRSLNIFKSMFFRMLVLYVFASAVIFQWHMGSWYGWLVGGGLALVLSRVIIMAQRHWLGLYS